MRTLQVQLPGRGHVGCAPHTIKLPRHVNGKTYVNDKPLTAERKGPGKKNKYLNEIKQIQTIPWRLGAGKLFAIYVKDSTKFILMQPPVT